MKITSILSAFLLTNVATSEEITSNKHKHVLTSDARSGLRSKQTGGVCLDFAGFGYLFNEFASWGSSEGSNGRQLTSETDEATSLVSITATSEGGLKVEASEKVTDAAVNWLTNFAENNKCDEGRGLGKLEGAFGINCCVCITHPFGENCLFC